MYVAITGLHAVIECPAAFQRARHAALTTIPGSKSLIFRVGVGRTYGSHSFSEPCIMFINGGFGFVSCRQAALLALHLTFIGIREQAGKPRRPTKIWTANKLPNVDPGLAGVVLDASEVFTAPHLTQDFILTTLLFCFLHIKSSG